MATQNRPVGELLRDWRQRRRLSQLDLALDAGVSARHVSFLETGRSLPSRSMLLRLAGFLDVPLRERNTLLLAAGYAPTYPATALEDPALDAAREAIDRVLTGHEPYPALAVDRHWNLIAANQGVYRLLGDIDPALLLPPVNVLRLSLHTGGLASRIANLGQWRAHVLARLRRQHELTADPALAALRAELAAYPVAPGASRAQPGDGAELVIPFRLRAGDAELVFFTTTMLFGAVNDVTLSELAIELFFPADRATAERMVGGV
ncbi:MAG TPA: helix-turn-helix transcriptional regulator [Thermomicrobiales bacterium]|nr:helix-turn-helix transcriptional regulator [Thermomicrobiales bacterium]